MLVEVRGVIYPSVAATSEALNVTKEAVYSALSRGKMDLLGLGNTRKKAVEIEGLHFSSMCEASLALGFSRSYLRTALTSGSERVKENLYRAARKYKRNLNKEDLPR